MAIQITESRTEAQLIAQRQAWGGDRWDEVWDGVYFMSPLPNIDHQNLVTKLLTLMQAVLDFENSGIAFAGVNVSDRKGDWTQNYRCPDMAVVLAGCSAQKCDTHWCGGPDFVVEIVTPDDRSRQKFDFYAKIRVREFLLVDRSPWALELYRLDDGQLRLVGRSTTESSFQLQSTVLPLNFRLVPGDVRPVIEVTHTDGLQAWRI